MSEVFICDAIRTPIGRYGGILSSVRTDDLAAIPLKELLIRNPQLDPSLIDDVVLGCANQAGEDNRNVARMSSLLAGYPSSVAGNTLNRLCGSGMDAIGTAARAIKSGEVELMIAGGVESMSRAPFVIGKTETAFARNMHLQDTTMGWRFINPKLEADYGVDSMPETAENVAEKFNISRADQDAFSLRSQQRAASAQSEGIFAREIVPVIITRKKQEPLVVKDDEHIRPQTTIEALSNLKTPFRNGGSITAGNASGINDGACALIIASANMVKSQNLKPITRIIGMAVAGVEPNIMGYGPVPAIQKLLSKNNLTINDIDTFELNEAFAAQALACCRALGLKDDSENVNPNGGAIALGHPLGMSGARLITTASYRLQDIKGKYAVCAMCIGVGQGIAILIERV